MNRPAAGSAQPDGRIEYAQWGDLPAHQRGLLDRGFTYEETCTWSFLGYGPRGVTQAALDVPCMFRDAGFTADQGRDWHDLYIDPVDASTYADHGWDPHATLELRRELNHTSHSLTADDPVDHRTQPDPSTVRSTERQWVTSAIPTPYVLLYVRAGHTLANARALESRRRAGDPTIEPALTTLAALRSTHP
jgi:hypothetical protein